MKKTVLIVIFAIVQVLICACSQKKGGEATSGDADSTLNADTLALERFGCVDSAKYAYLTIDVELPQAENEAAGTIHAYLLSLVGEHLSYVCSYESERSFPLYHGKSSEASEQLAYYFKETMRLLDKLSTNEMRERRSYLEEDSTLTAEQKANALSEMLHWGYEYKLVKTADTLNYVVFLSQDYIFMGGAHGGVGGDGYLTFSKTDGHVIRQFVDTTRVADMQPLLIQGLKQYYAEAGEEPMTTDQLFERLQLPYDGPKNQIPLPATLPCPTREGLLFCYGQYEIACYADGMPAFVVPYDKVKPFLCKDALQLLDAYLK
jgi:hypothetical protein